jgi:hypothetical protein
VMYPDAVADEPRWRASLTRRTGSRTTRMRRCWYSSCRRAAVETLAIELEFPIKGTRRD